MIGIGIGSVGPDGVILAMEGGGGDACCVLRVACPACFWWWLWIFTDDGREG
jgi:hypothetical protein